MKGYKFPLKLLLNVFYYEDNNHNQLMQKFNKEFNFKDNEMDVLFDVK